MRVLRGSLVDVRCIRGEWLREVGGTRGVSVAMLGGWQLGLRVWVEGSVSGW